MRAWIIAVVLLLGPWVLECPAVELPPDRDDADLYAIAHVGQHIAWAVGDRGIAWTSRDAGRTWSSVSLPGHVACRSVCFLSNHVGWIAGDDERPGHGHGVLLATRDGGENWQVTYPPLGRICHVRFFDLEHGVLVGGGGLEHPSGVVQTSDGGRSWQAVDGVESTDWRTAAFSSDRQGVVGGVGLRFATLARTRFLQDDPQARGRRAWWGSAIGARGTGWLVGDGASVLMRPPRAASWQTPPTPLPAGLSDTMNFRSVATLGGKAWIVGSPGHAIWHTPDGGQRWERQSSGQPLPLHAISMWGDGTGLAVGALGVIIRTSDAGRHWEIARGKGRRLAILAIHVTEKTLPLGVLARDSAELGYRSRGVLVSASPAQWRRADRTVRALGGQGVEAGWRLQLDKPELSGNARRLEQQWQAAAEGRLNDWLVGRFVDLVRTWRPSVVVVDEPVVDDHAAGLVHAAMLEATRHAADPTQWAIRASLTGLSPWRTRRIYERMTSSATVSVRVNPDTPLPLHGGVVGTLVEQGRLHGVSVESNTWRGDRLRRLQGSGKATGDSACQGLGLAPGSAARRLVATLEDGTLARAETDQRASRALAAWIRLAEGGSRPLESLLAELMPLLRPLGKRRAGWRLWTLAERFRSSGEISLSEALLTELLNRYPAHDAATAATARLLSSTVSQERRWQRLRRTGRQEGIAVPGKRPGDESVSFPGGLVGERRTQRAPVASDWRTEMTRAEIDRAIRLARYLKQHAEATYNSGEIQLTLSALFRSRGSNRLADGCNRRLIARPGPWHATGRQETWLAMRSGNPPVDMISCQATSSRPIIDGAISDRCWEAVPEIRLRAGSRTIGAFGSGFVVTTCDDKYLYMAARLERSSASRVEVADARMFDADHSGFDRLTIFLDTDRDYRVGYELTIDERGMVSETCGGDPSWNPPCAIAIDSDERAWRFEMAIRWSDLAPRRPPPGTHWGLRLVRTLPAVGWQGWGGTRGEQGAPVIGAGIMSFPGTRAARRRR